MNAELLQASGQAHVLKTLVEMNAELVQASVQAHILKTLVFRLTFSRLCCPITPKTKDKADCTNLRFTQIKRGVEYCPTWE